MDLDTLNTLLKKSTDDAKKKRDRILDGAAIDDNTHILLYDLSSAIQKEMAESHSLILQYLNEL